MIFDNSIDIKNGILKPNAHLEYNADISSSSESKFYYAADTSKSYVISNVNESNHNIRLNLGIDLIKDNGYFISKIFMGGTFNEIVADGKKYFKEVKVFKPKSSRKDSKESFIVCRKIR